MSKRQEFDVWEEEARIHRRMAEYAEQRRNEPLTRETVLNAIEAVALQYGANGTHESTLIADAFRALAEELK